jgi:hypothetical protein
VRRHGDYIVEQLVCGARAAATRIADGVIFRPVKTNCAISGVEYYFLANNYNVACSGEGDTTSCSIAAYGSYGEDAV